MSMRAPVIRTTNAVDETPGQAEGFFHARPESVNLTSDGRIFIP